MAYSERPYSEVDLSPFFGRHIRYFGLSLSVHSDVFRLVRFVPGFHILFMAEINATMLLCPVQGCGFTYSEEDRNAIRTHKARVHTSSVKVIYQNPLIEVVLNRTEDSFHCVRCDHSTQYPNAIQVRVFSTTTLSSSLMTDVSVSRVVVSNPLNTTL